MSPGASPAAGHLDVNVPPSIGLQSSNQTVNVGAPASFFVVASGTAPLSYQWRKDGTNIVGATSATNAIAAAQATDAGSYTVVVTNVAGSITNIPATLTVNVPPSIGLQSSNQTVNVGVPVSFFVVASGTAPFGYQWRKDGTNLVGATSATNTIAAAQAIDAGSYTVVVTNVAGSITNIPATLTVNVPPSIGLQSSNQTVNVGVPVSFFVVASGTAPFSYQWRKDGTNILGANSATNAIAAAQATDAGSYTVVVTNVAGSITNTPASLTIYPPPVITNWSMAADGSAFVLSGTGGADQPYVLLTTPSLSLPVAWTPVATNNAAPDGVFSFTDSQTTNFTQRFYRVLSP